MTELTSQPTPIQTIYDWYRTGKLIVNRRYQRKLVWTLPEKQKLIDSILSRYPVPLILLAEPLGSDPAVFEIIDGLQRLHAILSFIENAYPTAEGAYFDTDEFARAKDEREKGAFSIDPEKEKLPRAEVSKILDYVLPVSIIRNASNDVVTDVFSRINSYGHLLSEQERRQAGQLTEIARFVRSLACEIRGDVSIDTLPLYKMPEISVDLQRSSAGYSVQAGEVFWVRQGVVRSTDLRDSLDEQIISDIAVCITWEVIERSKEKLDKIFDLSTEDGATADARIVSYGVDRLSNEIKYCIEIIENIVQSGESATLGRLIFENFTGNSFATVFSAIFIAIHELSFSDGLILANAEGASAALNNIQTNMNTLRSALSPQERRNNINSVKGRLRDHFVQGDVSLLAYSGNRELDIENTIRRSIIETPFFEMKQGVCRLSDDRAEDDNVYRKVLETICAISNIGKGHSGSVFVGVADRVDHAQRIKELDGIEPTEIAGRWVVGVERECAPLGISLEQYYQRWRDKISNSSLSEALKTSVLSKLNICSYKDKHILIAAVEAQEGPSFLEGKLFVRQGDQTIEASAEQVVGILDRFK